MTNAIEEFQKLSVNLSVTEFKQFTFKRVNAFSVEYKTPLVWDSENEMLVVELYIFFKDGHNIIYEMQAVTKISTATLQDPKTLKFDVALLILKKVYLDGIRQFNTILKNKKLPGSIDGQPENAEIRQKLLSLIREMN